MYLERAQGARVVEHDTSAIGENDRRTCESRKRLACQANRPIAVHSEMREEHTSICEMNELMLAATFDRCNDGISERTRARHRQTSLQRRMQHIHLPNRFSCDCDAETTNRGLDFGELGHGTSAELTGASRTRQVAPVSNPTQSAHAPRQGNSDARSPLVRRTLLIVLALNAVVAVIKLIVGARTGALTVLGAALESGLDMFNNIMGVTIVAVAGLAPDENHPYGHDKFETLGALAIVGFLSITCFELLRSGVSALMSNRAPDRIEASDVAVISATLIVNAFVVWYERRRGRELGSAFLLADAAHTGSDILVTLMAIASLVLTRLGWPRLDGALAIAVAFLIAWSGYQILRQSIPVLVDERAIDANKLRSVVLGVTNVQDVRQVRSRSTASGQLFAEVTIVVQGSTAVDEAHRLADEVEAAIERAFGASQVTVHVEPA